MNVELKLWVNYGESLYEIRPLYRPDFTYLMWFFTERISTSIQIPPSVQFHLNKK